MSKNRTKVVSKKEHDKCVKEIEESFYNYIKKTSDNSDLFHMFEDEIYPEEGQKVFLYYLDYSMGSYPTGYGEIKFVWNKDTFERLKNLETVPRAFFGMIKEYKFIAWSEIKDKQ